MKKIPGLSGYAATKDGTIWSHRQGQWKPLKPGRVGEKDYSKYAVKPRVDGKAVTRYIACLILETFVGPRPKDYFAHHLNGNKKDCRLSNLEWRKPVNRLDERSVRRIRHLLEQGLPQRAVAERFGLPRSTVSWIKLGRIYKGVGV